MPKKRAIIFDFGGVLMKTHDHSPRHTWDDRLGLSHGSVERAVHNRNSWLMAQTGQISVAKYWLDVAHSLDLSPNEVQQLAADFYSGDQLDDDLIALIHERRDEGIEVALLSNDSIELVDKLDHLGIKELFDPLVISADIGVMKPDTAAYYAVLTQLNRPPNETIFIDDRPENVNAARAIGIHAIHYVPGMDLRGAMQELLYT